MQSTLISNLLFRIHVSVRNLFPLITHANSILTFKFMEFYSGL